MRFFGFVAQFQVGEESVYFGMQFSWVKLCLRLLREQGRRQRCKRLRSVDGFNVVGRVYFR